MSNEQVRRLADIIQELVLYAAENNRQTLKENLLYELEEIQKIGNKNDR